MFGILFKTVSCAGQGWHRHLGGRDRQISKTGKAEDACVGPSKQILWWCAQLNTFPFYLYCLLFQGPRFKEVLWVPGLVYRVLCTFQVHKILLHRETLCDPQRLMPLNAWP